MAEYSPSAATRQALIDAAGTLFAEFGIESVTTREIATAAKENQGLITYHFGTREDLLKAVTEYAMRPWLDDPFGKHVKDNSALLKTRKGQLKLVDSLIDLFFDTIFSNAYPSWCASFLFKFFQKRSEAAQAAFVSCTAPIMNAFASIYITATGDDSEINAKAWASMVLTPVVFHSMDVENTALLFKGRDCHPAFLSAFKGFIKASAKSTLGKRGGK